MSFTPSIVATLATGPAINDLRVLLASLEFWNAVPPTVYLYCDAAMAATVPSLKYKGSLHLKEALTPYSGLNRAQMEAMPGRVYNNLWLDFMCEKMNLLDWAFSTAVGGVLFCDADICFLGPMFSIPTVRLAVSRHIIRARDEARFGIYNGGMLWLRDGELVTRWRDACAGSRFFEQAAIEDVVDSLPPSEVYMIPPTENYGWWRLWQGARPQEELQAEWSINRAKGGCGIVVAGEPLGSVHTHFSEKHDMATIRYNEWVLGWLRRVAKAHDPTRRFLKHMKWLP